MVLIYLLFGVAFVWLISSCYVDIKKREVPDWLSYSLIAFGLGTRLIYSLIFKDFSIIIGGVLFFLIAFLFSIFMYYTKQWGGGDSKLIMGLGAVIGSFKTEILGFNIPIFVLFVFSIFFFGSIYSLIYSIILAFNNRKEFVKEWKKIKYYYFLIIILLGLCVSILSLFMLQNIYRIFVFGVGLFLIILFYLFSFIKTVENCCMYKIRDVGKLVEGDWLAKDVVVNKKILCSSKSLGLTKKDINNLKKLKVKRVLLKEGIPFVPSFLIAFIFTVVYSWILIF